VLVFKRSLYMFFMRPCVQAEECWYETQFQKRVPRSSCKVGMALADNSWAYAVQHLPLAQSGAYRNYFLVSKASEYYVGSRAN